MSFVQNTRKTALVLGAFILAGAALTPVAAEARVFVGVGFGFPGYYPGYYPGPYAYGPPVVYAPPPVIYQQPQISYAAPPQQSWYYCDNPQGYYPNVSACASGWRAVPASPPQTTR